MTKEEALERVQEIKAVADEDDVTSSRTDNSRVTKLGDILDKLSCTKAALGHPPDEIILSCAAYRDLVNENHPWMITAPTSILTLFGLPFHIDPDLRSGFGFLYK